MLGISLLGVVFLFFNNQVSKPDMFDLAAFWPVIIIVARASNISFFCSFTDKSVIFPTDKMRKKVSRMQDDTPSNTQK